MNHCAFDGKELATPLDEYQLPDRTIVCWEHFLRPPERVDVLDVMKELEKIDGEIAEVKEELLIMANDPNPAPRDYDEVVDLQMRLSDLMDRRREIAGIPERTLKEEQAKLQAWIRGTPIQGGDWHGRQMKTMEA